MVFVSVLVSPLVLAAATLIEGRLGAAAAGWVAALPLSFAVAVSAVSLDAGAATAGAMALSAATHVPAQVAFALAFAGVLVRRGLLAGLGAGVVAYLASALALAAFPGALVMACALPALALAPRLRRGGGLRRRRRLHQPARRPGAGRRGRGVPGRQQHARGRRRGERRPVRGRARARRRRPQPSLLPRLLPRDRPGGAFARSRRHRPRPARLRGRGGRDLAPSARHGRCASTLTTVPPGSSTKKRCTPQGSSVSG